MEWWFWIFQSLSYLTESSFLFSVSEHFWICITSDMLDESGSLFLEHLTVRSPRDKECALRIIFPQENDDERDWR